MMNSLPIVVLPGWLLPADKFIPLTRVFQKKGYSTHVISFPGFPGGEVLSHNYTLTDYVKFVERFLRQKKITQAIFVCHSFGGRVALKLLSQDPKRAKALVLSGTPGYRNRGPRVLLTQVVSVLGKILIYIPPFIFFRTPIQKLLYRMAGNMDYFNTTGLLRKTFKSIVHEKLVDYMKKIRIPTLLLWGESDGIVTIRVAKKMQKTIKNSQLVIVRGEKHNMIYKSPEKFSQEVLSFLDTL